MRGGGTRGYRGEEDPDILDKLMPQKKKRFPFREGKRGRERRFLGGKKKNHYHNVSKKGMGTKLSPGCRRKERLRRPGRGRKWRGDFLTGKGKDKEEKNSLSPEKKSPCEGKGGTSLTQKGERALGGRK